MLLLLLLESSLLLVSKILLGAVVCGMKVKLDLVRLDQL